MQRSVLAICGSTRTTSVNLGLLNAIAALFSDVAAFEIYTGIADLPHFNPDHDTDTPPPAVNIFREKVISADAVLICTPEYAMGVPGTLKNAIDWTVSMSGFSKKPVALITASSVGQKGHAALMATLKVLEADIDADTELVISFARTKISGNTVTDGETLVAVKAVVNALIARI